jgi:arylsulfatase A-like enzyme
MTRIARILAVLLVLAGCGMSAPARPPNVLLIVIDTLRADRLGCYGNPDGLTPFIDALAARGTLFRRAYAPSSWTNPSVASLFTSRWQSQHNIVEYGSVLGEAEVTLAETLRAAGYVTGGFLANGLLAPKYGFNRGFDAYHARWVQKTDEVKFLWLPVRGDVVNADAFAWLDGLPPADGVPKPKFLYVHYMEPHTPYAPSQAALARVFRDRPPPDIRSVNLSGFLGYGSGLDEETLRTIVGVYDAEVISVDAAVRALFDGLAQRGFLDHALVVLTADHGEEFQDHGGLGHERTLYEEVVHVPLVVVPPGGRGGAVSERVVSLIDVAPTVLEAVGVARPARFEGASLVPLFRGRDGGAPDAVAYTELIKTPAGDARRRSPHERALVTPDRKIIAGVGGEREFYRLDVDPKEKDPAGVAEAERHALEAKLAAAHERALRDRTPAEAKELDEATRERLRALGYAQ